MELLLTDAAPAPPSDWLVRWAPLFPERARVLDVACGHGRHVHWLAAAGHRLTAVDRDPALLAPLAPLARIVTADLEASPWPLSDETFDAVIVTNYLWRPLFPHLFRAVAPGGLLLVETFSTAQAAIGRPRRPEFLLAPDELFERVREAATRIDPGWQAIAFEQGRLPAAHGVPERAVQRIVARRGAPRFPAPPDLLAAPA